MTLTSLFPIFKNTVSWKADGGEEIDNLIDVKLAKLQR